MLTITPRAVSVTLTLDSGVLVLTGELTSTIRLAVASALGGTGLSAYQLAVNQGFVGSQLDWIASLEGASAYEVAVSEGFVGDEAAWLASLQGSDANVTNANVNAAIEDDVPATRLSLGLGTAALQPVGAFDPAGAAAAEAVTRAAADGVLQTNINAEAVTRAAGDAANAAAVAAEAVTRAAADAAEIAARNAAITAAIDALLAGAPGALDTLNELSAALGDDANFATTMTAALAGKFATPAGTTAQFLNGLGTPTHTLLGPMGVGMAPSIGYGLSVLGEVEFLPTEFFDVGPVPAWLRFGGSALQSTLAGDGYSEAIFWSAGAGTNDGNGACLSLGHSRGTLAVPAAVQVGDCLGTYSYYGYLNASVQIGAQICCYLDSIAGNIPSGRIEFTTNHSSGFGAKMVLRSSGALLLGTQAEEPALLFNMVSTTRAMGLPSMTAVQWAAIAAKRDGSTAYDSTNDAVALQANGASVLLADRTWATTADNAVRAYADTLVVGLVDDRGNYNASVNTFPAAGGSGAAGAVLKGDLWTVSVAGTLGGTPVTAGDLVRALVDTPGQTAGNWAVTENNIGYVAENAANKDTDGTLAANSDVKYASQKAVKTYIDGLIGGLAALYQGILNLTANTFYARSSAGAAANKPIVDAAFSLVAGTATDAEKTTLSIRQYPKRATLHASRYGPPFAGYSVGRLSSAIVADRLYAMPGYVASPTTISAPRIFVTTGVASNTARMGLVTWDDVNDCALALLVDWGTANTDTSATLYTFSNGAATYQMQPGVCYAIVFISGGGASASTFHFVNFTPFGLDQYTFSAGTIQFTQSFYRAGQSAQRTGGFSNPPIGVGQGTLQVSAATAGWWSFGAFVITQP